MVERFGLVYGFGAICCIGFCGSGLSQSTQHFDRVGSFSSCARLNCIVAFVVFVGADFCRPHGDGNATATRTSGRYFEWWAINEQTSRGGSGGQSDEDDQNVNSGQQEKQEGSAGTPPPVAVVLLGDDYEPPNDLLFASEIQSQFNGPSGGPYRSDDPL